MTASIDEVVARAREDGVRIIRFLYCDPSGVIRGKNVHVNKLAGKMREGVGVTRAQNAVNMVEQLVHVPGMEPIACLVRDLSNSGARLEVPDVRQVSDKFTLTIVGSWNRQACRVAWRKGNMVGVEYL